MQHHQSCVLQTASEDSYHGRKASTAVLLIWSRSSSTQSSEIVVKAVENQRDGDWRMRRLLLPIGCPALGAICYSTYVNRPTYYESLNVKPLDEKDGKVAATTRAVVAAASTSTDLENIRLTVNEQEFLRTGLYSPKTEDESLLLKVSRATAIGLVTALSKVFIEVLNDLKVIGNESNHENMINLIQEGKNRNRGMITVSNHTSVFDDPVLQACLTGFVHPDIMRWAVCKDSICFSNELKASFTGAGKVVPIRVGAGIEQPAFKALARRLADGEWIHIYPEAACIQSGVLGRNQLVGCRDEEKANRIGALKWGVGKLATHTAFQKDDLPPIIVPYYHIGMEKVKPQVNLPNSNLLADPWYIPGRIGNEIRVFVGPPIEIDDLIQEYERTRNGKRRIARILENNEFADWDGSTEEERELYSKITRRIENALLKLEGEANRYKQAKLLLAPEVKREVRTSAPVNDK